MTENKDSPHVVEFLVLFNKLRDRVEDHPERIEDMVAADRALRDLCNQVWNAHFFLQYRVKRRRHLFAAPVNPSFVTAWREYEARYEDAIGPIAAAEFGLGIEGDEGHRRPSLDKIWLDADESANEKIQAIGRAFDYLEDKIANDEFLPEEFVWDMRESIDGWASLDTEIGLDLRGVFRRRDLVPFVLIPRHVAAKHGSAEKLSLYTHLREAQSAFVRGTPFAALALMRSIMELVLRDHYEAAGGGLGDKIKGCETLPSGASKPALLRLKELADTILHSKKDRVSSPDEFEERKLEMEILSLLSALRVLIEEAPK